MARLSRFIKFTGSSRKIERKLRSFVRGLAAVSNQTTGTKFSIYFADGYDSHEFTRFDRNTSIYSSALL